VAQARGAAGLTEVIRAGAPREELAAAIEAHQRTLSERWARVQGGVVDDRPEILRTVVGLPVDFTNQTGAARLAPDRVEPEIEATESLLRDHGVPGIWWIGPGSEPADLGDALLRRGWRHDEDMPWMAADIDRVLADLPDPPAGLRAEAVEDDEAQARWVDGMAAGFGMGEDGRLAMTRLSDAVGYGREAPWRRFVGTIDGAVAGTSGLMVSERLCGIYNVTTVPDARRRGVASAMTGMALREGRERGYEVAILGASEMGYSVYRRLGFEEICRLTFYVFDPRSADEAGTKR
jgi:ribosomal protein S18 acetylase RimI-like enzyme